MKTTKEATSRAVIRFAHRVLPPFPSRSVERHFRWILQVQSHIFYCVKQSSFACQLGEDRFYNLSDVKQTYFRESAATRDFCYSPVCLCRVQNKSDLGAELCIATKRVNKLLLATYTLELPCLQHLERRYKMVILKKIFLQQALPPERQWIDVVGYLSYLDKKKNAKLSYTVVLFYVTDTVQFRFHFNIVSWNSIALASAH